MSKVELQQEETSFRIFAKHLGAEVNANTSQGLGDLVTLPDCSLRGGGVSKQLDLIAGTSAPRLSAVGCLTFSPRN